MKNKWSQTLSRLLGALIFLHFFLMLSPWHFTMPQNNLGASCAGGPGPFSPACTGSHSMETSQFGRFYY